MYLQGLLATLFYAAAALLAVAGAVKLRRPGPTSEALRGLGETDTEPSRVLDTVGIPALE